MLRSVYERVVSRIRRNHCTAPAVDALPQRMTAIGETDPADIFIVGYPKSGNTWFQALTMSVAFGLDVQYAPDSLQQDLISDVHYKLHYRRYSTPSFFKSHHLPQPSYRRVVYLLRDGRDVMVSYLHHLQAMRGEPLDFERLVRTGDGLYPCHWHEHVQAWQANPYGCDMLVIRYEDLKRDPVAQVTRFCEFVGLERDQAHIRRSVEQCSFGKMREREARFGMDNPEWPRDRLFTRRGECGSFKDEMPPAVLEAFMAHSGDALAELGYL